MSPSRPVVLWQALLWFAKLVVLVGLVVCCVKLVVCCAKDAETLARHCCAAARAAEVLSSLSMTESIVGREAYCPRGGGERRSARLGEVGKAAGQVTDVWSFGVICDSGTGCGLGDWEGLFRKRGKKMIWIHNWVKDLHQPQGLLVSLSPRLYKL